MPIDPSQALIVVPSPDALATVSPEQRAAEQALAETFRRAARSPATLRAYQADWREFVAWCRNRGLCPRPALDGTVGDFLSALAAFRSLSKIRRAYSAIALAQREAGHWQDGGRPKAVADTLSGITRTLGKHVTKKRAFDQNRLVAALATLPDTVAGLRDRAMALVTFWSACRRSEVAAFNLEDVSFDDPRGATLLVRRSKTDQEGEGKIKAIFLKEPAEVCPTRILKRWIETAGITEGPLFRPVTKDDVVLPRRLKPRSVARLVKRMAKALELRPEDFGAHSLRAGFVTSAHRKGKSLDSIAIQTGHASLETLRGYIRYESAFDNNPTEGM